MRGKIFLHLYSSLSFMEEKNMRNGTCGWDTGFWGFFYVYMRAGLRGRWLSWQQVRKGPSDRKPRLFVNSAINLMLYKRLLRLLFEKQKSEYRNNFLLFMNVPWLNRDGVKSTNLKVSGKTD